MRMAKKKKMLYNIFFSHGILRKGWKENKEKRRRRKGCRRHILLRLFYPLLQHSNHVLSSEKRRGKKARGGTRN